MSPSRLLVSFAVYLILTAPLFGHPPDQHTHTPTPVPTDSLPLLGHGDNRYEVDLNWAKVTPDVAPVINSHAIEEGKDGLLYLVTDHPDNAFLVFKKNGTFVRAFGKGLYGGHGLALFEKDDEEYLLHVDCGWHFEAEGWKATNTTGKVTLLKTDGEIIRTLPSPVDLGIEADGVEKFKPCDVAIKPSGTILIAEGYGSNFIYELTFEGELVRFWGGPNPGEDNHLADAHGISIDVSDPEQPLIWVPSRSQNQLKAFTLEGELVDTIHLPGLFAGQLFFRDDRIYTAVCWSTGKESGKKDPKSGFLLVLDRDTKRVISAPGGTEPRYEGDELQPIYQDTKTFIHGHDLYVDSDGAIYLGEWNADRRYPAKMTPVE